VRLGLSLTYPDGRLTVACVRGKPHLEKLALNLIPGYFDAALLRQPLELRVLELGNMQLLSGTLPGLTVLSRLEELSLVAPSRDRGDTCIIPALPALRKLYVDATEGIVLGAATTLRSLSLTNCRFIIGLAALQRLEKLRMAGSVGPLALTGLLHLPALKKLDLGALDMTGHSHFHSRDLLAAQVPPLEKLVIRLALFVDDPTKQLEKLREKNVTLLVEEVV
jgi:hypothetical protein